MGSKTHLKHSKKKGDRKKQSKKQSKTKKEKIEINILRTPQKNTTTFGGFPIDIFFGILYLKLKHKTDMGLYFNIKKSIYNSFNLIKQQKPLLFPECIIYKCKDSIITQDRFTSESPSESVRSTPSSSNSVSSKSVRSKPSSSNSASSNSIRSTPSSSNSTSTSTSTNSSVSTMNHTTSSSKNSFSMISSKDTSITNTSKIPYTFKKDDFEIIFPNKQKIGTFIDIFKQMTRSGKKFTAIPLIFRWSCMSNFSGHANLLFVDLENKTIERFEPYGFVKSFGTTDTNTTKSFDTQMKKMLKKYKFKYLKPKLFSPKKGLQFIEEHKIEKQSKKSTSEKDTDPEGFCAAWSLWYADTRMTNQHISRNKLINYTIKVLGKSNTSLRQFIRNYSGFLIDERKRLLTQLEINHTIYNTNISIYLQQITQKQSELERLLKTHI